MKTASHHNLLAGVGEAWSTVIPDAKPGLRIANRLPVPMEVAKCPECDGQLWWQVTTADGLKDLLLDCENETEEQCQERTEDHRWWQGDWEPTIHRVKRWIRSQYEMNSR